MEIYLKISKIDYKGNFIYLINLFLKASERSWKNTKIPKKQRKLVNKQLLDWKSNLPIPEFDVMFDFLVSLRLPPKSKIIEIGCSSGYYSEIIAEVDKSIEYFGVDYSLDFLRMAKEIYPKKNFFAMDINNISIKNKSFDCVILGSVLQHIKDWKYGLRAVNQINTKTLIIHRQPIAYFTKSYLSIKRSYGVFMHEWIINREEFIHELKKYGWHLESELIVNGDPIFQEMKANYSTTSFVFKKL